MLEKKYGTQAVKEIINICNLDDAQKITTLTKRNIAAAAKETVVQQIEHMVQDIIDLDKDQRWKPLRFDAGKNGKCDLGSIEEALVARIAELKGLIPTIRCRDPRANAGDFIDIKGQSWDVKSPRSYAPLTNEYIFDKTFKGFMDKFKNDLLKKPQENIILNVSYLTNQDMIRLCNKLNGKLSQSDLQRIIVIDRFTPLNNEMDFAKFLLQFK